MDARLIQRLQFGDWCLVGIALLQLLAVLGYLWKKRWLDAAIYAGYMLAQTSLILLSMRGRA